MAAVVLGVLGLVLVAMGASRPASRSGEGSASILVTARSVAAGATLGVGDVAVRRVTGDPAGLAGLLGSEGAAIGRRALVALPSGTPLLAALLTGPEMPAAGHRVVRVRLDAAALPPALQAGQPVEVMAAVADSVSSTGHLVRVAGGRLVAVDPGPGGSASTGAAQATVAVDLDAAGAARLLWAESFAKALSLLAAAPGDPSDAAPAEVDGLGPPASSR